MATATEPTAKLFEQTFDSFRQATESALKMQQEMYGQWAKMWPTGMPIPGTDPSSNAGMFNAQKIQQDWATAMAELMHKHREMLDRQYRSGIESLEEAFRAVSAENPDEMRGRCESLCRNALELIKETSESQLQQFQDAMNKWIDLCQTKP
jgi:hypothetical protein